MPKRWSCSASRARIVVGVISLVRSAKDRVGSASALMLEERSPVAARPCAPGGAFERTPASRACCADAERLGRVATRHMAANRHNKAFTRIKQEEPGHSCRRPSSASSLNQTRVELGISVDSERLGNARRAILRLPQWRINTPSCIVTPKAEAGASQ